MQNLGMIFRKLDHVVTHFIQKKQPNPKTVQVTPLGIKIFKIITNTMAPVTVIFTLCILSVLTLVFKEYIKDMFIFIFSVLPIVIGSYLKKIISRPRPDGSVAKIWVKEKSYNFPSTHAAVATSFYGFLAFLCIWYQLPYYLSILALSLIVLISYSRIYLGVHFITDVTGGIILGLLNLVFLIFIYLNVPEQFFSIIYLWLLFIISWVFVIKYYRKYPEDIPDFLRLSNIKANRIYTGIIVLIMAFIPTWIGGILFKGLMIFILCVGIYEIFNVKNISFKKFIIKIFSIGIITVFVYSIIKLRDFENGKWYVIIFILTAMLMDVIAYFIGKKYGKIKIFKKVSPNKSLEGAVSAFFLTTIIIGTLLIIYIKYSFIVVIILSMSAIMGDYLESLLKRKLEIKDFSNFLPGHGGILDRVDSNLFAGFIAYLLVIYHVFIFY